MTVRAAFVRRVRDVLADHDATEPVPLRLCRAVLEVVEADDVAVTVQVGTGPDVERAVLCSTGPAATGFEEAQDLAGVGPGFDVLVDGEARALADLAAVDTAWPALADVLAGAPLPGRGLLVLAMQPGRRIVGAMTLHHQPGRPLPIDPESLQFVADVVGAAVWDDLVARDPRALTWTERDVVAQATGMVVAQLGVAPRDARAVLRARAYADHTTVADLSHRVVAREVGFGDHGERAPRNNDGEDR